MLQEPWMQLVAYPVPRFQQVLVRLLGCLTCHQEGVWPRALGQAQARRRPLGAGASPLCLTRVVVPIGEVLPSEALPWVVGSREAGLKSGLAQAHKARVRTGSKA
jgi:hypothetical protein